MTVAPGWHPDPTNPSQVRWWDGTAWTDHTHPSTVASAAPATAATPVAPSAPSAPAAPGYGSTAYGSTYGSTSYGGYGVSTPQAPAARGNTYSFITMGIVAVYLVLAVAAHFVLLGIFPVLMSVRAIRAKEKLGWVAAGCAAVAVIVSLALLSGH